MQNIYCRNKCLLLSDFINFCKYFCAISTIKLSNILWLFYCKIMSQTKNYFDNHIYFVTKKQAVSNCLTTCFCL